MKIIKPADLTGAVDSNAPEDQYSLWQPVGRNFYTEINNMRISSNGTHMFLYDVSSRDLRRINIETGESELVSYKTDGAILRNLSASPSGQYIALLYSSEVRVHNVTTGALLYTDFCYNDSVLSWSQDSSVFSYRGFTGDSVSPMVVLSSSWTKVASLSISQINGMYREYPAGAFGEGYQFDGIVSTSSGTFYTMTTSEVYQDGGPPTVYIRKSIIGKLALNGSNSYLERSRVAGVSTSLSSPKFLFYNEIKDHVLGYLDSNFYAFDAVTFAQETDIPSLPGIVQSNIYPSLDGSEFIVTNISIQPYTRRYSSNTYLPIDDLDSEIGGATGRLSYSSEYIAFFDPLGGYGLIDIATGNRVTQANPSVTAGDIYTYADANYEALTDNNARPDQGAIADPPTWLNLGPINPLRMFDGKLDTLTVSPSPLVVNIEQTTLINGVALFNLSGATVRITVDDPVDGIVYDTGLISLSDGAPVFDWYAYFFEPYSRRKDVVRIDLPPYSGATITITIEDEGSDVSAGLVIIGRTQDLGIAQYGTSVGIIDFSRKEQDQFGNFEIIPRRFSKRAEYDVKVPTAQNASVQRTLADLRTTPVVWIGDEDKEETVVYGYYRNFDILLEAPSLSDATISVEGL